MSTFSHTDWTVICNGTTDGWPCGKSERTDALDLRDGSTAADVRRVLKRRGWAVNVPNPDQDALLRRLDFCPDHKPETADAGIKER
jgi:hypothetical protein